MINATGTSGVTVGMSVANAPPPSGLTAYDNVVAVSAGQILLASPATMNGSASTLTFTPDNGGSKICDSETLPQLYTRATYSYSPKDWGAFGGGVSGGHDDTVPLQNWIDAAQPHIGDTDSYMVTWPLGCPNYGSGTTIQGPANNTGPSPGGSTPIPLFEIVAGPSFSGLWTPDGGMTTGDPDARGVVFGDAEATVADGVIEQSNGTGLAGTNGLTGLDTGSLVMNTTYFFFVVADATAPVPGTATTPSCIASIALTPNWLHVAYGSPIYRLVGALYTDGSSNVVQFKQDGDTFYLANSVTDIKTGSSPICSVGTTMGTSCPLSVPCGRTASATPCPSAGFVVQAFGRVVGGFGGAGTNQLLLSSLAQADQIPASFPTAPGNTNSGGMLSNATPPVLPFHLSTDGTGNVRARASGAGVSAFEVTDGWVWHRQQ